MITALWLVLCILFVSFPPFFWWWQSYVLISYCPLSQPECTLGMPGNRMIPAHMAGTGSYNPGSFERCLNTTKFQRKGRKFPPKKSAPFSHRSPVNSREPHHSRTGAWFWEHEMHSQEDSCIEICTVPRRQPGHASACAPLSHGSPFCPVKARPCSAVSVREWACAEPSTNSLKWFFEVLLKN